MTSTFKALALVAPAAGITACSESSPTEPTVSQGAEQADLRPGTQTIVGIVTQPDGEFDVLQAAVVRAGLVATLDGRGHTPSSRRPTQRSCRRRRRRRSRRDRRGGGLAARDAARHPALPRDRGTPNSTSVLAAPSYQMLNGDALPRTQLQAAGIAQTDISASNGIIHVINAVLIPAS